MADGVDIGDLDQRARRAGYQDGLLEIFAAVVLLVIAAAWIANPSFVGILAAFIVLYGWKAVERVKEKVTYPRIGYHKERADEPGSTGRGMLTFILGAVVVMVLAVALSGDLGDASQWRRAATLLSGITLAAGFWYASEQSGFLRHRVVSVYSVVTGFVLWVVGSGDDYSGVVWHLVGLAVPLALIGIWALIRFTRQHPRRLLDG